jgi:hypothetical protein
MLVIVATFVVVFGRAMQQQHVIHGQYLAAAVTPYLIAVGEVATVLIVVDVGWSAIPYVGTGGALGATAAMWAHRRMWRRTV